MTQEQQDELADLLRMAEDIDDPESDPEVLMVRTDVRGNQVAVRAEPDGRRSGDHSRPSPVNGKRIPVVGNSVQNDDDDSDVVPAGQPVELPVFQVRPGGDRPPQIPAPSHTASAPPRGNEAGDGAQQRGSDVEPVAADLPKAAESSTAPGLDAVTAVVDTDFLAAWRSARTALMKLQAPNPEQPDRRTAKIVERLSQLSIRDAEEVIRLLDQLGTAATPPVIDTIRVWAGRRNRSLLAATARAAARIDSPQTGLILLDLATRDAGEIHRPAISGLLRWHGRAILPELLLMAASRRAWPALLQQAATELPDSEQASLLHRLKRLWKHPDTRVTALSIGLASRLPEGATVEDLQRMVKHSSGIVRAAVIEAMVQAGEKKCVRFINAAMTDPDPAVRIQASLALQTFCSPRSMHLLITGARDQNVTVRRNCAKALSSCLDCSQCPDDLVDLVRQESDPIVVESLLEALGRFDDPAVLKTLEDFQSHPSAEIRTSAIRSLRRISSPAAAPIFLRQLQDSSEDVRRVAVDGLGRVGAPETAAAVIRVLKTDSSAECRAAAARALGRIRSSGCLAALEDALTDSQQVQCQAVLAIGALRDRAAIPVLAALLKTSTPEIQYHTCAAIAELKAKECAPLIQALLLESDPMLQRGAKAALEKLGVDSSGPGLASRLSRSAEQFVQTVQRRVGIPSGMPLVVAAVLIAGLATATFLFNPFSGPSAANIPIASLRDVAVDQTGEHIGVVRKFGVVEIWQTKDMKLLKRIQHPDQGLGRAIYCNNKLVLLTGNSARVWDPAADPDGLHIEPLAGVELTFSAICVPRVAPEQYLIDPTGQVSVLNRNTLKVSRTFRIPYAQAKVTATSICADGSVIAIAERDGMIRRVATESGQVVEELSIRQLGKFDADEYVVALAISDDAAQLAIALRSGPVIVLNTKDRQIKGRFDTEGKTAATNLYYNIRGQLTVFTNSGTAEIYSPELKRQKSLRTGIRNPLRHEFSEDNLVHVYFAGEERDFWVLNIGKGSDAVSVSAD